MNLKNEIGNAFNKSSVSYGLAAKIQWEIGQRLIQRLDYLKVNPRFILDLGCGPGTFLVHLKKKYPKAVVIGLDIAYEMVFLAQKKKRFWQKYQLINGDMSALPFPEGTFDLIFANQTVHWSDSFAHLARELYRVLNKNGCLMFSTLGPDTFLELKHAWAAVDNYAHVNNYKDMHDLGDNLVQEHFVDPVVDMEKIAIHYRSLADLVQSLKKQGVRNINSSRNKGLTGKGNWQKFTNAYAGFCTEDNKYPLTYEVIYGHAWKGAILSSGGETRVPLSAIGVKKKL